MRSLIYARAPTPLFLTKTTRLHLYHLVPQLRSQPWNSPRHLWSGHKIPTEHSTSQSDANLSPKTETSDSKLFATGSSLATRMSTDRKFQCTQIDKKGDIFMGHGHIQRSELVSKVSTTLYQTTDGKLNDACSMGSWHVTSARSTSLSFLLFWCASLRSWSTSCISGY